MCAHIHGYVILILSKIDFISKISNENRPKETFELTNWALVSDWTEFSDSIKWPPFQLIFFLIFKSKSHTFCSSSIDQANKSISK